MTIKNILDDEIRSELENLSRETIGSDNYKANIEGVTKLLDRRIRLEEIESEREDRAESRENDMEMKSQQIKEDRRERYIKHGITIGTFVGTSLLYVGAFIASTNFEREGTLTTEGGRSALRKLLTLK